MKESEASYHLEFALFLGALVLLFLFVRPLLTVLLASAVLAYIFYPVFRKLKGRLRSKTLAICLTLLLMLTIFMIPFTILLLQIPAQAEAVFNILQDTTSGNPIATMCTNGVQTMCQFQEFLNSNGLSYTTVIHDPIVRIVTDLITSAVINIPVVLSAIMLVLFVCYYLFADGPAIVAGFMRTLPMLPSKRQKLLEHCTKATKVVVYANLMVAFAQGLTGTLGYYLLGIPYPILLGFLTGILSFIPVIGGPIVWAPVGIYLIIHGASVSAQSEIMRGGALLLYGAIIISTLDNIVRSKVARADGTVHPLTLLIGIIGGVEFFGIVGLFIGPVIFSLALIIVREFSAAYRK